MMKSYWGEKVDITLIYDKSRGNISVGESTTPILDYYYIILVSLLNN